ncbi:MAG: hypothetical protein WDO71_20950 [Bacteroidota bacterium]
MNVPVTEIALFEIMRQVAIDKLPAHFTVNSMDMVFGGKFF